MWPRRTEPTLPPMANEAGREHEVRRILGLTAALAVFATVGAGSAQAATVSTFSGTDNEGNPYYYVPGRDLGGTPDQDALEPSHQSFALAAVAGERRRQLELGPCLVAAAQLLQQVASHAWEQVVGVEGAFGHEVVHDLQAGFRAEGHGYRHRSVQLHHG